MADVKITQLPQATLPLAGSEVFPLVQNGTTVQAPVGSAGATTTVAVLRTVTPVNGVFTNVEGYYAAGDGGGGQFYAVSGATPGTYVDNGGTIIVPTGGNGSSAWLRVVNGPVSVRWFGAQGNGVSNDAPAIQACVNYLPASFNLSFDGGTYNLESPITFAGKINVVLEGGGSTIRSGANYVARYFDFTDAVNVSVRDFVFDGRQQIMPATVLYNDNRNIGVYSEDSTNLYVENCRFINLYTVHLFSYRTSYTRVSNCYFQAPVANQNQFYQCLMAQTVGDVWIENCQFIGDAYTDPRLGPNGIFASGVSNTLRIENNEFNYLGRNNQAVPGGGPSQAGSHRLGVIDLYYDVGEVTLINNVIKNCMAAFYRGNSVGRTTIQNNNVSYNANASTDEPVMLLFPSSITPSRFMDINNVLISGNTIDESDISSVITIQITTNSWDYPSKNIRVEDNTFINSRFPVYTFMPVQDTTIANNRFYIDSNSTFNFAVINVLRNANITGTEANGFTNNLSITDNIWSTNKICARAVEVSYVPVNTAQIGNIEISRNEFTAATAGGTVSAVATFLNCVDPNQIYLKINDNIFVNCADPVYPRNSGLTEIARNRCKGLPGGFILSGSGSTLQNYLNRQLTGVLYGTATLSGGTVTVSSGEIRSGDRVIITRKTSAGTTGNLSLGTIVDKTSFVISSTSATDTSVVYWEIVH